MDISPVTFGIAEDERIESNAMRQFIEHHFPESSVLWQEADGERALSAVRANPPQVLIVDINMPVMDGLTMCEHLCKDGYDGVILINTAFDSFQYARQAITLRAFDYIVKPVENAELRDVLANCIAEAHRRAASRAEKRQGTQAMRSLGQLVISMLAAPHQDAPRQDSSMPFLEALGWPSGRPLHTHAVHIFSPVPFTTERIRELEQAVALWPTHFRVASDFIGPRQMLALIEPPDGADPQALYTRLWTFGTLCTRTQNTRVRISAALTDEAEIAASCRESWPDAPSGIPDGEQALFMPPRTWRMLPRREAERFCRTAERLFCDGQPTRVRRRIQEMSGASAEPQLPWELLQWTLCAAMRVWPEQDFLPAAAPMFAENAEALSCLERLLDFCAGLPAPSGGDAVDRALRIMREQFAGDLSQSTLAESLGLDQAYFCRLFKRRTGQNFSEALLDIRMQHAEAVLRENPRCSLDALCRLCGLTSKTYFSEAFKKWKGMTITQFIKTL